ncbi:MAG TPA: virulence RhuM family protein [Waddliaceae bacterium]
MEKFEILLYSVPEGKAVIEVFFEQETFWLSQKKMAELFNVSVPTVNEHLQNVFIINELKKESVIRNFRITAADGKNYNTQFYHLDAIIAVGYRVNSLEATRFRIWATKTLREFIIKGFVLDDERLKQGKSFGRDYFEELLERIREIRASERRFYQKITDIYAQCSIDYDPQSDTTFTFYKTVQNKLHWAVTGQTAAEIIHKRVDAAKPNMGLTTWKNAPEGKISKTDVRIAKNYLQQQEIEGLNRVVTMYLDYAENQARRNIAMSMADWVQKLDAFLQFNEYNTLKNAGSISHDLAQKLAEEQYEQYRIVQDQQFESDFDKLAKNLSASTNKKKE